MSGESIEDDSISFSRNSYLSCINIVFKTTLWCSLPYQLFLLIVPSAFSHWHTVQSKVAPPPYTLTVHSSQPVFIEHAPAPLHTQADALFLLCRKLGKRHEVCMDPAIVSSYCFNYFSESNFSFRNSKSHEYSGFAMARADSKFYLDIHSEFCNDIIQVTLSHQLTFPIFSDKPPQNTEAFSFYDPCILVYLPRIELTSKR